MNAISGRKTSFNRRALATQSMQAAAAVRLNAGLGQFLPICVYDLCEKLGIPVRFNNINMEGMYERSLRSRIHLSALRPLQRRAYNCAHELGHHIFGHGSSIDELREDAKSQPWEDPKEFQADTFAGFLLMPAIGLRRSFSVRGWSAQNASPLEIYAMACEFGVGYATLLNHLSTAAGMLSFDRANDLKRISPKDLKQRFLGVPTSPPLVVLDAYREAATADVEVGTQLILPMGSEAQGVGLTFCRDLDNGRLFRAENPGIVVVKAGSWLVSIRVAPQNFAGLAQYRHMEEEPDE